MKNNERKSFNIHEKASLGSTLGLSILLLFSGSVKAEAGQVITAQPGVWTTKQADDNRANHETIVNEQRQREIKKALQNTLEVKNNDHDRGYRKGSIREPLTFEDTKETKSINYFSSEEMAAINSIL